MAKLGMLLAAMLSPLLIAAYIMADDWMGLYLVLSLGAWPAISFWAHNRRIQGKPSAASDCLIRNENAIFFAILGSWIALAIALAIAR